MRCERAQSSSEAPQPDGVLGGLSVLAQGERERSFQNAGCPEAAITTVVNVY